MGSLARPVGKACGSSPGVPSPAAVPTAGPAPLLSRTPVLSAAAGINYASAARGGRSHVLGRAPVTLRDPWHCHAVPGAPAENAPVSSLGDPIAPH